MYIFAFVELFFSLINDEDDDDNDVMMMIFYYMYDIVTTRENVSIVT